jgi:hypothetical protein
MLAAALVAQTPQTQPAPQQPGPGQHRDFPAPTNLKVLPKTLTGNQVRDIMEGWSGALGVHCNACHTADPTKTGPNGRPRLNFPDDSKPEKNAARLMAKMTADVNENYVSMIDLPDAKESTADKGQAKVSCGTCHRGHMKPEAFIPPPERDGPPPVPQPKP